jgi:hypothetical protein
VPIKVVQKFSFFPIIKLGEDGEEIRKRRGRDEERFVFLFTFSFPLLFPVFSSFYRTFLHQFLKVDFFWYNFASN